MNEKYLSPAKQSHMSITEEAGPKVMLPKNEQIGSRRALSTRLILKDKPKEGQPSVWERMEKRIEDFNEMKKVKDHPEMFYPAPSHDPETG